MRAICSGTRGFTVQVPPLRGAHQSLSPVDLSGLDAEFGLEQVFPHALSITDDGCWNFWVIDLTSDSQSWGPVFYACHDPAVVVYHADNVAGFIEDVLGETSASGRTKLEAIHDKAAARVWVENPGVMSSEDCIKSSDDDLRMFAQSLDASYEFVDLRNAKPGDGFSWGRYGAWTVNKRFGEKRLFAYQKKTKWERFRQFWKR